MKMKKYPSPAQVHKFLRALVRRNKKHGSKYYKKHRDVADRVIKRLLKKFQLKGTGTSKYWALKGICILIGKELY